MLNRQATQASDQNDQACWKNECICNSSVLQQNDGEGAQVLRLLRLRLLGRSEHATTTYERCTLLSYELFFRFWGVVPPSIDMSLSVLSERTPCAQARPVPSQFLC